MRLLLVAATLSAPLAPVTICGAVFGAGCSPGTPVSAADSGSRDHGAAPFDLDNDLAPAASRDLRVSSLTHDLAPAPTDMAGDAADLAVPDLGVTDAALPVEDLAARDAGDAAIALRDLVMVPDLLCGGGYLNSPASDACPLSCSPDVVPVPDESRYHIAFCSEFDYVANPPSSGPHWPYPAPWGAHTGVVPREWWVHNLEHQGLVLLYNCPDADAGAAAMTGALCNDGGVAIEPPAATGCPMEIAELEALVTSHPADAFGEDRILVTADPKLPMKFAALAWDWRWMADTLDVAAVQCLIDARYGRGPELAP